MIAAVAVAAVVVLREAGKDTTGGSGRRRLERRAAAQPQCRNPTPPPKIWVAAKTDPVKVWVGGDSMGGELGWALGPVLKDSRVFKPTTFYKESTGICRYDFFDWGKQIDA